MATRSYIGIKNLDETVNFIYCHWDGYPNYNGVILKEHYQTIEQTNELLDLGDLSVLAENTDKCVAYGRDKGETDVAKQVAIPLNDIITDWTVDYVYVFDNNKWTCYSTNNGKPIELYN